MSHWPGVRKRIERVMQDAFGEGRLAPPLSVGELLQVESACGSRLPEEYRTFLTEVSAGGIGPHYGVFTVKWDGSLWGWEGDGAQLTTLERLSRPFTPALGAEELEELATSEPDPEDEAAYEAWLDAREDVLWRESRTDGAICICHEGCALRQWLVVSGPHAGEMWLDHRADGQDLQPMTDAAGEPIGFKHWYLAWLEAEELARC